MNPITQFLAENTHPNIKLGPFDKNYFDSLPEDRTWLDISSEMETTDEPGEDTIFTLFVNGKRAGVAGCFIGKYNHGFFMIYLEKKFRGKNLLCPVANTVFKKLRLDSMSSTIDKKNKASVKSHLKSGCFKEMDKEAEQDLRRRGLLKSKDIRLDYIPR